MTADSLDNYNYEPYQMHITRDKRAHYWAVASGLQDVDGLCVSEYASQTAKDYIDNKYTLQKACELVHNYHQDQSHEDTAQADLVSIRIMELLERNAFCLAPEFLSSIHKYLFQDQDAETFHPGEFKTQRMVKQEEILNGDSVLYADPTTYKMSLSAIFNQEASRFYTTFDERELDDFCHTISCLWHVHPFYEGNTRTIAVFSELYLNQLGFSVTNEPFEKHSAYYRDALVRSIYRNAQAKIFPDKSYVIAFYQNLLLIKDNNLSRNQMFCKELFDNPALLKNINPGRAFKKSSIS